MLLSSACLDTTRARQEFFLLRSLHYKKLSNVLDHRPQESLMSQTCDSHIFATHGSPSIEKNTWRKASTRENQRSIENNRVGDISASGMKERNTADSGFLLSVTQKYNTLLFCVLFVFFLLPVCSTQHNCREVKEKEEVLLKRERENKKGLGERSK